MKFQPRLNVFLVLVTLGCGGCDNFRLPSSPSNSFSYDSELTPVSKPVPKARISIADVIFETNNQRRANGLNSLNEDSKLNKAADFKMRDMFARQYFSHYAPDQTSGVVALLTRFNYSYMMAGENLALGDFKNANELVAAWMASPGHRANILNGVYRDIGVATGYDLFKGKRTIIIVQIFGTSR